MGFERRSYRCSTIWVTTQSAFVVVKGRKEKEPTAGRRTGKKVWTETEPRWRQRRFLFCSARIFGSDGLKFLFQSRTFFSFVFDLFWSTTTTTTSSRWRISQKWSEILIEFPFHKRPFLWTQKMFGDCWLDLLHIMEVNVNLVSAIFLFICDLTSSTLVIQNTQNLHLQKVYLEGPTSFKDLIKH